MRTRGGGKVIRVNFGDAKRPQFRTPDEIHRQILRDHIFVEEVNRELHGKDFLLERTSYEVFEYHHQGCVNARAQRQRWKKRKEMRRSSEGSFCVGCCWQVEPKLVFYLKGLEPSLTREEAEEMIEIGRKRAALERYKVYAAKG